MYIIAGLGNPSLLYNNTRHNIGFQVIDAVAEAFDIPVKTKKYRAFTGTGLIAGQKVLLMKPQTYMNLSGDSVKPAMDYYQESGDRLVVIYDDVDLDPGILRIRKKGSAGGHNGMKHIISRLGYDEFVRIRVGVGACPEYMDMKDYVLGRFSKGETAVMEDVVKRAVKAVELMMLRGADAAMNQYNGGSVDSNL